MSQVTIDSTSGDSPTSVYTGIRRLVRVKNNEKSIADGGTGITLSVRDPSCNTNALWVTLPPQEDHVFKRGNTPAAMVAYGDNADGILLVNEIGD